MKCKYSMSGRSLAEMNQNLQRRGVKKIANIRKAGERGSSNHENSVTMYPGGKKNHNLKGE